MTIRASLVASAALAICASGPLSAQDIVTVAIVGDPDTFDPVVSTKDVVSIVTQHIVETLYTFDSAWSVVPLLAADMPTISDDGLVYTVPLREDVTFHDGTAMDSADVAASLIRWETMASRGMAIADTIASIEATGPAEVTITLTEPYAPLLSLLAFSNSAAAIYPEETLADQMPEPVGTGPYMLEERLPDQYTRLTRFEAYTQPVGGAEERQQIPDEIRFVPVPDTNTRVEGLLSGQFDFADSLSTEAFERIEGSDRAQPVLLEPFGWPIFAVNHKQGLMTDLNIRKAVQAALPVDDMLFAAFGDETFFQTDGALYPEGWAWRNEAGLDLYNVNDQAAAAQYLEQAGYDGRPLRILTSRQYEFHYQMAEVARMALEMAGFSVQLDVVDWATLAQNRDNPELWDMYITHSPFLPEPALTSGYFASSREGWDNPEKNEILERFTAEVDPDARREIFAELQQIVYDDVGLLKIGNFNSLQGQSRGLDGIAPSPWPAFWNASRRQ